MEEKKKRREKKEPRQSRGHYLVLIILFAAALTIFLLGALKEDESLTIYECLLTTPVVSFSLLFPHLLFLFFRKWWKSFPLLKLEDRESNSLWTALLPLAGTIFFLNSPPAIQILTSLATGGLLVCLISLSRMSRNTCESDMVMEEHRFSIARNFAEANYRFLRNVITGGKNKLDPFQLLISEFQEEEGMCLSAGEGWFCPRLVVLFPEWTGGGHDWSFPPGSVPYLDSDKEPRNKDVEVLRRKITQKYVASAGNERKVEIDVLKIKDRDTGSNAYVAVAENRQLNQMYSMISDPRFKFTETNFRVQFHIYLKHLKQKLEDHKGCPGNYQILHYKDNISVDLGQTILRLVKQD